MSGRRPPGSARRWIRGAVPGALLLVACQGPPAGPRVSRVEPGVLPLELDASFAHAEFSGIDWWGDDLVILPQFPTGPDGPGVLLLERDSLARAIDQLRAGSTVRPLRPRILRVDAVGVVDSIPDYDGLEAIAMHGDRCFALAEYGDDRDGGWGSRLLAGRVERGGGRLRLERVGAVPLEGPQVRRNFTWESLLLARDEVWVLSELNGIGVTDRPELLRFDLELRPRGRIAIPPLEYRVTDATDLEPDGRFWVLNLFWPEDVATVRPLLDDGPVERLVPLRFDGERVVFDDGRPVLDLRGQPAGDMHNWEGVARWGDEGFLLVTDSYPADLLAYVARPDP